MLECKTVIYHKERDIRNIRKIKFILLLYKLWTPVVHIWKTVGLFQFTIQLQFLLKIAYKQHFKIYN